MRIVRISPAHPSLRLLLSPIVGFERGRLRACRSRFPSRREETIIRDIRAGTVDSLLLDLHSPILRRSTLITLIPDSSVDRILFMRRVVLGSEEVTPGMDRERFRRLECIRAVPGVRRSKKRINSGSREME